MNMLELIGSALVLMVQEIVLQGLIGVILGINAADKFANPSHSGRKIFENVGLGQIDDGVRVVIEDHSICVELLNWLETLRIAVAKFLFILIFGYSWELKYLNLLRCSVLLFLHLVSNIEAECNKVSGVKLLRLFVVGYVN